MHGLMLSYGASGSGGGGGGSYKGGSFAVDTAATTTPLLPVPAGAATGDYLVAVLVCRGDRSFTIPGDWTVVAQYAGDGTSGTARRYIVQKAWSGETTVAFTQSVSAVYGYTLLLVSKPLGAYKLEAGSQSAAIVKSAASSDLLSVLTTYTVTVLPGAASPDYVLRGSSSFNSGSNHQYSATVSTKAGVPAGTATANTPTGSITGPFAFLAEIGS